MAVVYTLRQFFTGKKKGRGALFIVLLTKIDNYSKLTVHEAIEPLSPLALSVTCSVQVPFDSMPVALTE